MNVNSQVKIHKTMSMQEWLKRRIKKAGENIESTITKIILLALLGGSAGILALSKKALDFFLQILTTPTPLWATIALVAMCYGYIYIKRQKSLQSSENLPYTIEYFTIDNLKWKTKIFRKDYFEVERIAVCKEHDIPLINGNIVYYCPESLKNNCKIKVDNSQYSMLYAHAKSYIDKEVRNKK